jgi:hypothetical protein
LSVEIADEHRQAIGEHSSYVQEQTLALDLRFGAPAAGAHQSVVKLAGADASIGISVA